VPIQVKLVSWRGAQVAEGAMVNDLWDFILRCASEEKGWRLLQYVDPYGDTYFNTLQMPDFLADWDAAKARVGSRWEEKLWREVQDLARKCEYEPHLFLKFEGD